MNVEDYIRTQSALSQTLTNANDKSADFALFTTMLGEFIDLERQHIGDDHEMPPPEPLSSINDNTQKQYHLQAQSKDFSRSYQLSQSLHNCVTDFRLMMSVLSLPLSLHNDPRYIDEHIVTNCPHKVQVKLKTENDSSYMNGPHIASIDDDEVYPEQTHLIFDTVSKSRKAAKALEV